MAEPTEGAQTSEFRLAKVVMVVGACVDGVAILLESLKQSGLFPYASWLPVVLGAVGTLSIVLAQLGYTKSRTMVKLAEAMPSAVAGIASVAPLVKAAVTEVRTPSATPPGNSDTWTTPEGVVVRSTRPGSK